MDQAQRVADAEWRPAGRQLVQRRAQRVQVGAVIHWSARPAGLLRGEVRQRPVDPGLSHELETKLGQRGRQREVDEARGAPARHHDVRRADVPMHHAAAVHRRDRAGQGRCEREQLVDRERLRQVTQRCIAGVGEHDRAVRPRRRRVHQLRHTLDPAQPLEDRELVAHTTLGVPAQRLLADDDEPRQPHAGDPRTIALLQHLDLSERIARLRYVAWRHQKPPAAGEDPTLPVVGAVQSA